MFNLMAVVINKQMNKVFYCFDPNFARNISIIAQPAFPGLYVRTVEEIAFFGD